MSTTSHGIITWMTAGLLLGAGLTGTAQAQITSQANGNWHATGTWVGGVVPVSTNDAIIATGHTVTVAQATTAYTVSNLTVNGTLTHTANNGVADPHYRVDLTVLGDLAVAASGAIDVRGRGYAYGKGPAPGNAYNTYAAYHGGVGASPAASPYTTYGSVTNPTTLGSGGDGALATAYGGGAIVLRVDGATTVDGQLRADAADLTSDWRAGAAGGSVNLITDTISGSGLISANGNTNSYANSIGGGGGRVAVKLKTGTGFDDVKLFATGGSPANTTVARRGAAGTVYRQTALQDDGEGDLIIDNNGIAVSVGIVTLISSNVTDAVAGDVIFSSTNAWLGVGPGAAMTMSGGFSSGQASASLLGVALFGGTLNTPAVLSCSNLTLRFAGPSTFSPATSLTLHSNAIVVADAPHTLTGNLILKAGSLMTHTANNGVSDPHYRIDLTVGGDLTVEPNGVIDVKGKGYALAKGPAPGYPLGGDTYAASHGGLGGGASVSPYTTYGSITNPTTLGSGGCGWSAASGGGAVILRVSGSASHNGMIRADGADVGNNYRGGSAGGSVNLSADTLSGTGVISANGNTNYYSSNVGGGGGRVAVLLRSGADCGGVSIRAFGGVGGDGNGAPGPIYLQTAGQAGGAGTLMVNGGGNAPGSGCSTLISTNVPERWIGSLIITNSGVFGIATNVEFGITSNFVNYAQTASLGGTFVIGGGGTSRLTGTVATNRFYNFASTNAGKRIEFESGKAFRLDNVLTLEGADGDLLQVDATDAGLWELIILPAKPHSVQYVDARLSDAREGAPVAAFFSTNRNDTCLNWTFAKAGETNTWTGGGAANAWGDAENWALGRPPVDTDAIRVPAGPLHWPYLNTHMVYPAVLVESGAELRLNGYDLTVQSNLVVTGTLTASGSETLTLEGDADLSSGTYSAASSTIAIDGDGSQALSFGANSLHAMIVRNTSVPLALNGAFTVAAFSNEGADLTFPNAITAGSFDTVGGDLTFSDTLDADTFSSVDGDLDFGGALTVGTFSNLRGDIVFGDNLTATDFQCRGTGNALTFAGGGVYTVTNLTLSGSFADRMVLASATPGSQWQLNVSGVSRVSSVEVSDSDASGGLAIRPIASVPGAGANNHNWIFDSGTWKVWTGASADFMASGNWNPSAVPGPGDSLIIETTTGMTAPLLTNALTVADLSIGGLGEATLTVQLPVTVTNHVTILPDGKLTHTANNGVNDPHYRVDLTILGDLTIHANAAIDVTARGYASSKGHAPGTNYGGTAAIHGGLGNYPTALDSYTTYGSITNPTTLGSGGNLKGGGAVILRVSGATTLDGMIKAEGELEPINWRAGASGGSVNLTTDTLSGGGSISANGNDTGTGSQTSTYGGGGGRIAVKLLTGESFGDVAMTALGGSWRQSAISASGAPGTIYLQTGLQSDGEGTLIVDAGGLATKVDIVTLISTNVTGAVVGNVEIRPNARLGIGTNAWLTVNGSFTNAATGAFTTQSGSTVAFAGSNAGTVWGNNTFHNLILGDPGTKPLFFEKGKTQTVLGDLSIERAVLRSTSDNEQWYLTLDLATGTQSLIQRVAVRDSNASNGQEIMITSGGSDLGNNLNWVFPPAGTLILLR